MLQFALLVDTEESAAEFAREHGLLLSEQALNNNLVCAVACALGTQGCIGTETTTSKEE